MSIRGPQITLVATDAVFDPQYGYETRQVWRGSEAGARGLAEAFRQLGLRHTLEIDAGIGTVVGYSQAPSDGTFEVPSITWELNTDYAQLDLRECPRLIATAGDSGTLAKWIKDSDKAIDAGHTTLQAYYDDILEGAGPAQQASEEAERVFNLRARGVEAYEVKRPVLSRVRTYSLSYVSRFTVDAVERFYTTASLLANATFAIPRAIGELLPSSGGTAPSGTEWGWRMRRNDQRLTPAVNKIEEVTDWVFAAWSTDMYLSS